MKWLQIQGDFLKKMVGDAGMAASGNSRCSCRLVTDSRPQKKRMSSVGHATGWGYVDARISAWHRRPGRGLPLFRYWLSMIGLFWVYTDDESP
jgi:hypothetical protein